MKDFDKPVANGDEFEVTIEAKGNKGDGIAHIEGFVVFVRGGNVGEKTRIKIQAVRRTFAIGEIIK